MVIAVTVAEQLLRHLQTGLAQQGERLSSVPALSRQLQVSVTLSISGE